MPRSYPIWIDVTACIYQGSKSYGARNRNLQHIKVGTSASNSHQFAKLETTRTENKDGTVTFNLEVDGRLIKTATLDKNELTVRKYV